MRVLFASLIDVIVALHVEGVGRNEPGEITPEEAHRSPSMRRVWLEILRKTAEDFFFWSPSV